MPVDIEDRLAALRSYDHLPALTDPTELRKTGTLRTRRTRTYAIAAGITCVAVLVATTVAFDRRNVTPTPAVVAQGPTIESGVVLWNHMPVAGATITGTLAPVRFSPHGTTADPDGAVAPWTFTTVTTASDGTYQLSLDPANVPAAYRVRTLNFVVNVAYRGERGGPAISVKQCGSDSTRWCAASTGETPTLVFSLGSDPETLDSTNTWAFGWQTLYELHWAVAPTTAAS